MRREQVRARLIKLIREHVRRAPQAAAAIQGTTAHVSIAVGANCEVTIINCGALPERLIDVLAANSTS